MNILWWDEESGLCIFSESDGEDCEVRVIGENGKVKDLSAADYKTG